MTNFNQLLPTSILILGVKMPCMYSMYSLVQKTIKYTRKIKALYLRENVLKPYILYMICGIRGNSRSGYNTPSSQKRAPHALGTGQTSYLCSFWGKIVRKSGLIMNKLLLSSVELLKAIYVILHNYFNNQSLIDLEHFNIVKPINKKGLITSKIQANIIH
jgi:hypothetical protein